MLVYQRTRFDCFYCITKSDDPVITRPKVRAHLKSWHSDKERISVQSKHVSTDEHKKNTSLAKMSLIYCRASQE